MSALNQRVDERSRLDGVLRFFRAADVRAGRPLHVTVASDSESRTCFVIYAYWPEPDLWDDDFRTRRDS